MKSAPSTSGGRASCSATYAPHHRAAAGRLLRHHRRPHAQRPTRLVTITLYPVRVIPGISSRIFYPQRLTPAHLDAFAASGALVLELFAARFHFDYTDRQLVRDTAAWFRSNDVRPHPARTPHPRQSLFAPRLALAQPRRQRETPPHRSHGRDQARA